MQNLLCVQAADRGWMRLAHYEGLEFDRLLSEDDDAEGDGDGVSVEGLGGLRRRVQASLVLNAALVEEKKRNEELVRGLCGVLGLVNDAGVKVEEGKEESKGAPLGFLRERHALSSVGDAQKPVETTAAFILSQMPSLQALSTSLRGLAPTLRESAAQGEAEDGGQGSGSGSSRVGAWRKDRVEYVETLTKKHLENSRGLELGEQGEVRDGEWQGDGRKMTMAEVEGLERVTALLGGGVAEDKMDES